MADDEQPALPPVVGTPRAPRKTGLQIGAIPQTGEAQGAPDPLAAFAGGFQTLKEAQKQAAEAGMPELDPRLFEGGVAPEAPLVEPPKAKRLEVGQEAESSISVAAPSPLIEADKSLSPTERLMRGLRDNSMLPTEREQLIGASLARRLAPLGEITGTKIVPVDTTLAPVGYLPLTLPSNFIPYAWKSLWVRRFKAREAVAVTQAQRLRNLPMLVAAIAGTIHGQFDIGEMTISDFRALCWWHRGNSYLKSPYVLTWRSRYGNWNETPIPFANLKQIKLVPELLAPFTGRFEFPRLADLMWTEDQQFDDADQAVWELAEIMPFTPEERALPPDQRQVARMARVKDGDFEATWVEERLNWYEASAHGVYQEIEIYDAHYKPEQFQTALDEAVAQFEDMAQTPEVAMLLKAALAERDKFEARVAAGDMRPEKEVHRLIPSLWEAFPRL